MQIDRETLEDVVAALRRAVDDLDEWVACKDALEKAGFNMDDTRSRAEEGHAALARLRKAMGDEYDPNNPDHGEAWKRARSKLVEMLFRLADAKGESYEAMLDIAANEILKAAFPRKAMEDGKDG